MGLQTGRNKVFALHRPIQSPSKRSHRPSWGVPERVQREREVADGLSLNGDGREDRGTFGSTSPRPDVKHGLLSPPRLSHLFYSSISRFAPLQFRRSHLTFSSQLDC